MRVGVRRIAFVTAGCLLWLTGCETTSTKLRDIFGAKIGPMSIERRIRAGNHRFDGDATGENPAARRARTARAAPRR